MAKSPIASTSALLTHYSFDLHGCAPEQLVNRWISGYPPKWVVTAVVEALYQGRYKAASVDRILLLWYLRGQPLYHFDYEFADIICSKLFQKIPGKSVGSYGMAQRQISQGADKFIANLERPFNLAASMSQAA